MKYIGFLVFISLLLPLHLFATIHEDAEDKKIDRWERLKPFSLANIDNIYDESKKSRVIRFKGDGTRSAYIFNINESKNRPLFYWKMKYSEDFVIFISLETKLGERYLIYTSGNSDSYMKYGLGVRSVSNTWQRFSRDLDKDLRYFDNRNSIIKVKSFVIRGSGSIDDIKIINKSKSATKKKRPESAKEVPKKLEKNVSRTPLLIKNKNSTPIITIEGENPLFLELGEEFVEPGVSAKDKNEEEIVVTSSENIDKHKEGKYAVIYMATDLKGNSAIDKRYVIVGEYNADNDEADEESSEETQGSNTSSSTKTGETDEQYKLEERELEVAEWEKELQLREREITQREKRLEK